MDFTQSLGQALVAPHVERKESSCMMQNDNGEAGLVRRKPIARPAMTDDSTPSTPRAGCMQTPEGHLTENSCGSYATAVGPRRGGWGDE